MKPVLKPTPTVAINALGTVRLGSVTSSARCKIASIPAYIRHGVVSPVRKVTPSDHPVLFSKLPQTWDEGCFSPIARQVIVTTRKPAMASITINGNQHIDILIFFYLITRKGTTHSRNRASTVTSSGRKCYSANIQH